MITGSDIAPGKRVFDIAVSLSALILLVPVLVVIALLVKLSSPGPVFYRQHRVSAGRTSTSCRSCSTCCAAT